MQKAAVFVVQFAAAAAGSSSAVTTYGAAGCAEGDLKKETMLKTKSFVQMLGMTADYTMGSCMNKTTGDLLALSQKISCNAGFMAIETYLLSDTCEEANLYAASSFTFNCHKSDDDDEWTTVACNVGAAGYDEYPISMYSTSNCSGDPSNSLTGLYKNGKCSPDATLSNGNWTAKSSKLTNSDGVVTSEEFSTMDCSGTASESQAFACGACEANDDDYMIITCPGKLGNADGAFRPSCILPVLTLLAVGAMRA